MNDLTLLKTMHHGLITEMGEESSFYLIASQKNHTAKQKPYNRSLVCPLQQEVKSYDTAETISTLFEQRKNMDDEIQPKNQCKSCIVCDGKYS